MASLKAVIMARLLPRADLRRTSSASVLKAVYMSRRHVCDVRVKETAKTEFQDLIVPAARIMRGNRASPRPYIHEDNSV